jgi:HEAT repeat protein
MRDALERMSLSTDWVQRLRAARLVARLDPRESEAIILRLLCDPDSKAVTEAMVAALLETRREAAIPLVLRSLADERATSQCLLEGLLNSELDGVEVRESIVSVLLETDDRDEVIGALGAIGWLAPSGGFPASPAARARVKALTGHCEGAIRVTAVAALAALAEPWQSPEDGEDVR